MEEDHVTELIPYLKERGLRITPQRILLLKTILSLNNHPTVEDIHRELPFISLATIYNNVKLFVHLNILKELPYGNGLSRFELANTDHYHVICEACGMIVDFNYPKLKEIEDAASKLTHYAIHLHELEIYGLCTACQKSRQA